MPTCWKCEAEVPEGFVECPDGCTKPVNAKRAQEVTPDILRKMADERRREFFKNFRTVDWNKVKTFDDLKAIFIGWVGDLRIAKKHPDFKNLEKYLKPDGQE